MFILFSKKYWNQIGNFLDNGLVDLIERLKGDGKIEHRSLNNIVECVLCDVAYNEPNEVTKAAMEEVRSGKLRDVPPIDTSSVEALFKSMGL